MVPEGTDQVRRAAVDPAAIKLGYEPDNVGMRGLGIFLVWFCIGAVVIHVLAWMLLMLYMSERREAGAAKSAVARIDRPVEPNLQPSPEHDTTPPEDLARMRAGENRIFAHMGWETDGLDVQIPPGIVSMLQARRPAPTTSPVRNAYEIPYVPATQPTGVTPAFGSQTTTPPPPYPSSQPGGEAR